MDKGYKYLFDQTKKFRFKQVIKNKRFLKDQKELLKKIKGLSENDKAIRTFIFSLRWGISWKVNPHKNYEENNRILKSEMLFPPPISLELKTPIFDFNVRGTFGIDLQYPDRAIISSFWEQLKSYRDIYKKKIKNKTTRIRLDAFETYLKVYQLREAGDSWAGLAKKFYVGADSHYGRQKVKRDYLKGKKLVENNFRQIR